MLFTANNGTNGRELWISDGTLAGTTLLKDIEPGSLSSNLQTVQQFNNVVYFTVANLSKGQELWRSNGTPTGTFILKDICPGACSGMPGYGSDLLFPANGFFIFCQQFGICKL
ncbi:MAG: hypothetical protein IPP71_19685 [Bacteroidetes bacterium]|nr:hypothetical protein [Bacteroidota bacterium]